MLDQEASGVRKMNPQRTSLKKHLLATQLLSPFLYSKFYEDDSFRYADLLSMY